MKKRVIVISVLVVLIIIVTSFYTYWNSIYGGTYRSTIKCKNDCINDGWNDGQCEWPRITDEEKWLIKNEGRNFGFPYSKIENRGSCVEAFLGSKSAHCGNKGQCNCYCFDYTEEFKEKMLS